MKITQVEVRVERTFNLKHYESIKFGCTYTAELEEFDSVDSTIPLLFEEAETHVRNQARPLLEMRGLIPKKTIAQEKN